MDYTIFQIILVFIVTFIAAIDQFSFLESLYQPIVTGMVIGLILGDLQTGLIVGGTYQLMTIGNMPVGGAQPPNAVIGGIMAAILAITLQLEPTVAVATAIPFSLLGQYGVTIIFSLMSPVMSKADSYAHDANTKGIDRINYLAMAGLGTIFGLIVVLFFIGGAAFGKSSGRSDPSMVDGWARRSWGHDAVCRFCDFTKSDGFQRNVGLLLYGVWFSHDRNGGTFFARTSLDHSSLYRFCISLLGLSNPVQV